VNTLVDGLDDDDEVLGMTEALADARARPHRYRLTEENRQWAQEQLDDYVRRGRGQGIVAAALCRYIKALARDLALDREARNGSRSA